LKTSKFDKFILPSSICGGKRILSINSFEKVLMDAILEELNPLVRVGEFSIIEILSEIDNVFINALIALLIMFKSFSGLLLCGLILKLMVKMGSEICSSSEASSSLKSIVGKCLTPIKSRTTSHEGQGDEDLFFVVIDFETMEEEFNLLDP